MRLARAFLVAALLLAQHAALAHQLDHVTGASPEETTLCDSHDLLGTVLGVASGGFQASALLQLADVRTRIPAASTPKQRPLSPQSRGPPTLS